MLSDKVREPRITQITQFNSIVALNEFDNKRKTIGVHYLSTGVGLMIIYYGMAHE